MPSSFPAAGRRRGDEETRRQGDKETRRQGERQTGGGTFPLSLSPCILVSSSAFPTGGVASSAPCWYDDFQNRMITQDAGAWGQDTTPASGCPARTDRSL